MAYTPIAIGSLNWGAPVNAAFTSQDTRISAVEASTATPAEQSMNTWTYDPVIASSGTLLVSGTVYMAKLRVTAPFTTDTAHYRVAAGTGLTAGQNFVGLYDAAGTRVAVSADLSTDWASTGTKATPWAATAALSIGYYYMAWLSNGTTPVTITRGGSISTAILNIHLTNATLRWSTGGTGLTGLTALPASITMANRTSGLVSVWSALS